MDWNAFISINILIRVILFKYHFYKGCFSVVHVAKYFLNIYLFLYFHCQNLTKADRVANKILRLKIKICPLLITIQSIIVHQYINRRTVIVKVIKSKSYSLQSMDQKRFSLEWLCFFKFSRVKKSFKTK